MYGGVVFVCKQLSVLSYMILSLCQFEQALRLTATLVSSGGIQKTDCDNEYRSRLTLIVSTKWR